MDDLRPWPIDFDALEKGQIISAEECDAAMSTSAKDPHRALKILQLKGEIERKAGIVSTAHQGGLRLLVDGEVVDYRYAGFCKATRAMSRNVKRGSLIDTNKLTDEQRRTNEARGTLMAAMFLAARKAGRSISISGNDSAGGEMIGGSGVGDE